MTPRQCRQRGFTLVEVLVTCTLVGVAATLALPGYQAQIVKSRRVDAVAALTKLQAAQEQLRANTGAYSADLSALRVPPLSGEGLYTLTVVLDGPERYRAIASAAPGSAQAQDRDCPQIELRVNSGFAETGPSPRCWNR